MKNIVLFGVLFAFLALASARSWRQLQRSNFIADGSNYVAVNILQELSLEKKNAVFSPLGYNTILALLTEGARGTTRNQLVSSLKLPEDTYAVRSTFKRVLSAMTEREVLNKPEFRNWFYVYKNYTVEDSFRKILLDNYLVDIKTVDRMTYEEDDPATSAIPSAAEETTEESNNVQISSTTAVNDSSEEDDSKEKDKDGKDSKKEGSKGDKSKENESKEDKSKENESKEDQNESEEQKRKIIKKPTNVMKIKTKEETLKEQDHIEKEDEKEKIEGDSDAIIPQESSTLIMSENEKEDSDSISQTEAQKEQAIKTEKVQEPAEQSTQQSEPASQQPEQQSATISSNIKPEEISPNRENETTDLSKRTKRETVNFLSVNNISSMENERETGLKKMSRMLVFNALYFKGNWSTPFQPYVEKRPFKVSPTEEVMVDMIHAEDEFEVGRVPDLDAWAIDLPYQGERYSLMILVPAADDGLEGLLKRLSGFSFYNVDKHLTKLKTRVCIPKLKFHTISKPKDAFIKSGINDLFNTDADLSGISGSKGLYLEELVQLVQFEIDQTESTFNYLTTSSVSDLRATSIPFTANEPFIFFLRDKVENLNVVAGIVYNPAMPSEF